MINIDKVKPALDHLQAEKHAQQHRLKLAPQAKKQLDEIIALRTHFS